MAYFLKRSDGEGSSGPLSAAVWIEDRLTVVQYHATPRVGICMRVGPLCIGNKVLAWETSPIEEILLQTRNYVKFRTKNSVYEWWEK